MKPRAHALKISAVVGGVLLLCLVAAWFMWAASADRAVDAKLQELEEAGYATNLARLAPSMPADEDNAAALYDEAFAGFPTELEGYWGAVLGRLASTPEEFAAALTDEERSGLGTFFEDHAREFELLDEAAARPRCVFARDYSKGYEILLPQTSRVILTCKILAARALLQASSGDASGAARTIEAIFATAGCCGEEPILVSQLVRIVGMGIGLDVLQSVLSSMELPPEALKRIRDRLDPDALMAGVRLAYRGELAFAASFVRELRGDPGAATGLGVEVPAVLDSALARPLLNEDFVLLLDTQARMIEAAEKPYPEAAPALAAIDAEIQANVDWRHPFTGMLVYAVGPSQANAVKRQSRLVLARAAIEVLLTGELREPPIDPMTGMPIQVDAEDGVLSSGGGETWRLRRP